MMYKHTVMNITVILYIASLFLIHNICDSEEFTSIPVSSLGINKLKTIKEMWLDIFFKLVMHMLNTRWRYCPA